MPQIGKYMSEQPMQYIKNKKVLADYWLRPFCLSSIGFIVYLLNNKHFII
jgi:hypothetical protein